MNAQHRPTPVQREHAIQRYDDVRRDLVAILDRKLADDARLATDELQRLAERRQIMEHVTQYVVPLRRYIERELAQLDDAGYVEKEMIDPADVLMDAVITAQEEIPEQITSSGVYPWLREICRQSVQEIAHIEHERLEQEVSLDAPQSRYGPEWPDRVRVLRAVLADPKAILPDDVLTERTTRHILENALKHLPERWREVFLLRSVDAWDDDEIAYAEGIDASEVELINLAARAYLRECLRDCSVLGQE
jgi:DNA-directed RNA polymerase specialized sigma24 family protein